MDKTINVEISTGSDSQAGAGGATSNSRMAAGGGTSTSNTSAATATRTTQYFPHGVRLSVWANQM
ncbi:MAG: hypothetical protein GWN58_23855, partial [Anaerolineae bacterium]|nr:hypothetical protein [Anaerolineae bacterium]